MKKLLVLLALIGAAYWYWTGPYQKSTASLEADQLQENAATMQRCINQEQRMQGAGALGGVGDVGSSGQDAERVCAEKNHLYKQDGNWYRQRE